MESSVIIAIISGIITLTGYILGYLQGNRKKEIKFLVWQTEIRDELKNVNKKLDDHNKYAEKFGAIQKSITKIEKDNISIRKDIEYLKNK